MFLELPRWFGFPHQVYIDSKVALSNFLRTCNGHHPCFMVPCICPTRDSIIIDKITNDFDHMELNIPYEDVADLKMFFEENGVDYRLQFSGNKGFHIFPGIKPIYVELHDEDTVIEVKTKVANIQLSLQNHLGLKSLDPKVIGDIRRIIRIPTTAHVDKQGKANGMYCRHLTPEQFDEGLDHILELAKSPGQIPSIPNKNVTIDELIDLIPNYKIRKTYKPKRDLEYLKFREGTHIPTIDEMLCPCIKKALEAEKPPHTARRETTVWLKYLGYTDKAIVESFRNLNWRDWKFNETTSQVRSLYARRPDCSEMSRMYGIELCNKCPLGRKHGKTAN